MSTGNRFFLAAVVVLATVLMSVVENVVMYLLVVAMFFGALGSLVSGVPLPRINLRVLLPRPRYPKRLSI